MHVNEINGMLRALKPAIKSRRKARHTLQKYWRNRIAIIWTVDDVYRAANERSLALSQQQAIAILQRFFASHNKQYGLQWSDLIDLILNSGLGRKMTRTELSRFINHDLVVVAKLNAKRTIQRNAVARQRK